MRRSPTPRTGRLMASLLMLSLLLNASLSVAAVRAFLDRDTITLGETVTLNIESDSASSDAPDLTALQANFHLRGTSSNSHISLVNGRPSTRQLWAVAIEPLAEGVIGIPALAVAGEQTEPLTLTVLPAPTQASTGIGDEVFLEVEATPRDPYVQQQISYIVRLYYAVDLAQGQLDEPQADGVRVQRLGADARYQKRIGERRYEVIERRYALVPERSGTLHIAAPRFIGDALDGPRRGLFGGGRRVQASGDAVDLAVRAQPSTSTDAWLPAQSMSWVDESGTLDGPFRVGEPISLSLRLRAVGLSADQLPELRLTMTDGAQVYPDQASSQTREDGQWLIGERSRRFAVVPSAPGELEIPAMRVSWWNVVTDRAEVAELPARRLQILPAVQGAGRETTVADADPALPDAEAVASGWRAAAWVLGTLWLLTLALLIWRWPRRVAMPLEPVATHRPVHADLASALSRGEPAAIAQALRNTSPLPDRSAGLDVIAAALADAGQSQAVVDLDRWLYAGDQQTPADALVAQLRQAFAKPPAWHQAAAPTVAEDALALPPLYRADRSR